MNRVPVVRGCIELEEIGALISGACGTATGLRRKGFEDENWEFIVYSSICQKQ